MLHNKISTQKRNKIFMCFCEDITTTAAAKLAGVNHNTVNYYYNRILLLESLREGGIETGEFELDESYFGAKHVRGKRGRGAAGKAPVFGLLKRGGKVFVKIVKNCSKPGVSQRKRICAREVTCQRDRKLLVSTNLTVLWKNKLK